MNLSANITLAEMTANNHGFTNQPGQMELLALEAWAENIGQPIRDHYGLPLHINSGFRCPALNKKVGGAANSQHMKGEAGDIWVEGVRNDDLWRFITGSKLPFDQCVAEYLSKSDGTKGWIHVSFALHTAPRKQAISCIAPRKYVPGLVYARV